MKKLSQLLESINEVNSLLELDFTDKKAFQKYQAKHKMKPTTKINIAGKDTTVGDEMGDDSEKPQAPKKTTGADIEKQASKSGKEKSDIEKDIMGDEPKSDEPVKVGDKKLKVNTKELKKDFKEKTKEYDDAYEMHTNLDDELYYYDDYDKISDKELRDSISYDLGRLQDKLNTISDEDAEFKDLEEVYVELETIKKQVNDILDRQAKPKEKDIMGDEPKSDEPVKLDGFAQDAIDDVEWNRYDDPTGRVDIAGTAIKDFDDNVDEWNQQIYDVASELEGQIPDEDLDKLYSAEVNAMDLDDEALSEVPKEELEKKAKALADIHKKYSTIGKKQADKSDEPKSDEPKSEPKKKGTGLKKPSSLDSYYAKEDAKKKWLASNPGKTDYDWSRLPYGTMSDLIDKEMRAKGFKENFDLRQLSKISTRYNK
jgi:hypothetical protein